MNVAAPQGRIAAWVDASACLCFTALAVVSYFSAQHEAEEAVRLYGQNVDSGAYLAATVVIYLAPAALLFGLAAVAQFLRWRWRVVPHILAWAFFCWPILAMLLYGIKSAIGL
jgi:hypothetical protein